MVELEGSALDALLECDEREGHLTAEYRRLPSSDRESDATLAWLSRQLRRLQELAAEIGTASTIEHVAEIAVDHGAEMLGVANSFFYLTEPDGRHAKLTRSWAPSAAALHFGRISLAATTPIADAMIAGVPILLGSARELSTHYPAVDPVTCEQAFGRGALALLPLVVEGRSMGMIMLAFGEVREFLEHEGSLLSLFAIHCAESLRRARAVEQERRYHQRIRILSEASDLLAQTLEYEPTLRTIVRMTMPVLADFCFLDVIDENGRRRICDAFEDPETGLLLERSRWFPCERGETGRLDRCKPSTTVYSDFDEASLRSMTSCPEQLDLLRRLSLRSLISVPLLAHGERFGTLTLCHGRSGRRHTRGDVVLAEELGLRAAQAVCHARLYLLSQRATRHAEQAAVHAEEASRLKDQFLTTVSHELRTPLSAILGWSMLLRRERRATAASLDKGLEVIERNARAQQRIIEDILDVSRIVCGKFRIKSALVNLETIANEVSDSLRSAASARNVELVLSAPGGPHQIRGDADRLRQIVWNLLSNAVKFTPSGGTVKLQIERVGDELAVTVRDTGDGIEPDFLPFVFQHFRQGDGTTTRVHGGLGLGLAMVRHLAEMHGGTVSAQSDGAGKGATFTVLLPTGTQH